MGLIVFLLSSCSEKYERIDPSGFNKQIHDRSDIQTPEDLIRLFYNWPATEGHPQLQISSEKNQNSEFTITLIHDKEKDDSEQACKVVMRAVRTDYNHWQVKEIRKNWRCWSDRGHTAWGIKPCE